MRRDPRNLFMLSCVFVTMMLAGSALADRKSSQPGERDWAPPSDDNGILADVADVEPNNSIATAQAFSCGDVLRPASLSPAADVDFISFTAAIGTIITFGTDADGASPVGDTFIRLYNSSGVSMIFDDNSGPGNYSFLTFTAPYTGVYYASIKSLNAAAAGDYKAYITCLAQPPPPPNDQCSGAMDLCGPINLLGTTRFSLNNYSPYVEPDGGCTFYPAAGRDIVYQLNALAGDVLDVVYTNMETDGSIYLITDCASPTTSCVAGADETIDGQPETLTFTIPTSGIYYLILDSFNVDTSGFFTLTGTFTCHVTPTVRQSWGTLKFIYR